MRIVWVLVGLLLIIAPTAAFAQGVLDALDASERHVRAAQAQTKDILEGVRFVAGEAAAQELQALRLQVQQNALVKITAARQAVKAKRADAVPLFKEAVEATSRVFDIDIAILDATLKTLNGAREEIRELLEKWKERNMT